jgi:hypothetical protein
MWVRPKLNPKNIYDDRHPLHHLVCNQTVMIGEAEFWEWEVEDLVSQINLRVAPECGQTKGQSEA